MTASKEAARVANADLEKAAKLVDECNAGLQDSIKRHLVRVKKFIEATERRLPAEKASERDRQRRKQSCP